MKTLLQYLTPPPPPQPPTINLHKNLLYSRKHSIFLICAQIEPEQYRFIAMNGREFNRANETNKRISYQELEKATLSTIKSFFTDKWVQEFWDVENLVVVPYEEVFGPGKFVL
jgi:hypothetical protein